MDSSSSFSVFPPSCFSWPFHNNNNSSNNGDHSNICSPYSPSLVGLLFLTVGYGMYYFFCIAKPTSFYYHPDSPYREILQRCVKLRRFFPSFLLINSHAQTLGSKFMRAGPLIHYTREMVKVTDEEAVVAIDWDDVSVAYQSSQKSKKASSSSSSSSLLEGTPVVLVMHGLVGSSVSKYVKHCVLAIRKKGWTAVVMNARGCGSSPLLSHKMFNGECTADVKAVVHHIKDKYPQSPLFVIGFSLGANILSKYLGEAQETTPVLAAVAISNPFNFSSANKLSAKNKSFAIYNRGLAKDLTSYIERHIEVFKKSELGKVLDFLHISKSRSIQEFDERCVIKVFGYKTIEEYYACASCLHTMPHIKVPLLCVNASDDPFIHPSLVPVHLTKENPNLIFALTERGGHIAFLQNFDFWNSSWSDEAGLEFLDQILQSKRNSLTSTDKNNKNSNSLKLRQGQ